MAGEQGQGAAGTRGREQGDGDEQHPRGGLRALLTGLWPEPDGRPCELPGEWAPKEGRIGICCSGGGIRSAAYSLGALQRLQRAGKLRAADYLSAVSGGSYIATALTIARQSTSEPFAPNSPEERYLRNRTNYLVPHGNEAVFLGYRVVLGIAINVLLVGLALGVAAIVAALFYDWTGIAASDELTVEPEATYAVVGTLGLSVLLALGYVLVRLGAWGRRERARQSRSPSRPTIARTTIQTWVVRLFWAALAAAVTVVLVPVLADLVLNPPGGVGEVALPAIPLASAVAFVSALLSQLFAKPPKELAEDAGKLAKAAALRPKLLRALAGVAATVAVPLLALSWIAVVVAWAVDRGAGGDTVLEALALGSALLFALLRWGDLTSWSLHPYYRARLASVFALRREGDRARALDTYREIPRMHELQPPAAERDWPTLVVCAAANVSDPGATPFGRRVTSFTFSSDWIGGPLVGYLPAADYEQRKAEDGAKVRDLRARSDAMAAVAVSGAAISPSMGKLTYRAGRALLALANVRLGVWLPNPRVKAKDDEKDLSARERVPERPRPYRLFLEMLGLNSMRDRYLYVTDGGHYENLGLVELLRRGCTEVYCFDGSGGKGVGEELGDAIAIARGELGVEIDVDMRDLQPNEKRISAADHVVATIEYPPAADGTPGPTGRLVYCRQLLTAKTPEDVKAHARRNPEFPHDPTTDQFLPDQSFESYRALGDLAAQNALDALSEPPA